MTKHNKIKIGLTNNQVKKSRTLIHDSKYDLTLHAMRYWILLITQIKTNDTRFFEYVTTVKELGELLNTKVNTKVLDDIAKELTNFRLPYIDEDGSKSGYMNVFEYIRYDKKTYSIYAKFGETAKAYLLEFKNHFLVYGIENVLPLPTTHIVRLYEICKDKLDCNPKKPKIVNFDLDIEDMRDRFEIKDSYKYSHIKDRILNRGIKEFEKHTDINISFSEKKKGRAVYSLRVTVIRKDNKNKKPSPILKFREKLLNSLLKDGDFKHVDEWDYLTYNIAGEYNIFLDDNGKPLLADDEFRIFTPDEASEEWKNIYKNRNSLFNPEWIKWLEQSR